MQKWGDSMEENRIKQISSLIKEQNLGAILMFRTEELTMGLGYQPLLGQSIAMFFRDRNPILYVSENEPLNRFNWELPEIKVIKNTMNNDFTMDLIEQIKIDFHKYGENEAIGIVEHASKVAPVGLSAEGTFFDDSIISKLKTITEKGTMDISSFIHSFCAFKNETDIACLETVYEVAKEGIKTFYANLQSGKTETDVKCEIEYAISKQCNREGIFSSLAWAQIQTGENSKLAGIFNVSGNQKLKDGDFVVLELAVCVNGYWCDLTRTGYVGTPDQRAKFLYEIVKEAQQSAIQSLKKGVLCAQVYEKAMQIIKDKGYEEYFRHALGHSVGFKYHDYGPVLSPTSKECLKEGMLVTVEPGIYGDKINGGIRIEDNIVITKDGYKVLSSYIPSGLKGEE